jgi:hypothetical protein
MPFALCGFKSWKYFFVQISTVSMPFSHQDGDAIGIPFSISNLNPNFPLEKF